MNNDYDCNCGRRRRERTQKNGPRRVEGPRFRACFSLSRHNVLSFFLSWGSFRGILAVFEAPGPEIFTFGVLGLSCEALAGPGSWRRNSKRRWARTGQHQPSIVLVLTRASCICTFHTSPDVQSHFGWTLSLAVFSCAGVCICPFPFPCTLPMWPPT